MGLYSIKQLSEYAKFLKGQITTIDNIICSQAPALVEIKEDHYKSRAYPEAQDELGIAADKINNLVVEGERVIEIALSLTIELARVTTLITKAKARTDALIGGCLSIDSAMEVAGLLRNTVASRIIGTYVVTKPIRERTTATGYKMNVEGNQVAYTYPMERTYMPKFDAKSVNQQYKKVLAMAEELSRQIDFVLSRQDIEFEPRYNKYDNFEDIMKSLPHSDCKDLVWEEVDEV